MLCPDCRTDSFLQFMNLMYQIMKKPLCLLFLLTVFTLGKISAQAPVVSDISYVQRVDGNGSLSKMVDIEYVLEGNRTMFVEFFFSPDGADSFPVTCTAVTGDSGPGVEPSEVIYIDGFILPGVMHSEIERKQATWDASVDWDQNFTDRGRIMIKATYGDQPTGFPGLDGNGSGISPGNPAPTHIVPSADNLEMIWVEPGTFMMGQVGVAEPVHEVALSRGFYLGKYEVTQAQYEAVMTGNVDGLSFNPSSYQGHPERPVESVSFQDIQVFISRLNNLELLDTPAGWIYALPTEAEWEYACRAGTNTAFHWGDAVSFSNANFPASDIDQTRNVGDYIPNSWGFYDMHGNVSEWVEDWYQTYPSNPLTDPQGPSLGSERLIRGGSWQAAYQGTASSADRHPVSVDYQKYDLGFRLALKQAP